MKPLSSKQLLMPAAVGLTFAIAAQQICKNNNFPYPVAIATVAGAIGVALALAPFMLEKEDIPAIKQKFRKLFRRRDCGGPVG